MQLRNVDTFFFIPSLFTTISGANTFFVDIRNVVDIQNEISDSCDIASYSFHIIAKFYLEINYE